MEGGIPHSFAAAVQVTAPVVRQAEARQMPAQLAFMKHRLVPPTQSTAAGFPISEMIPDTPEWIAPAVIARPSRVRLTPNCSGAFLCPAHCAAKIKTVEPVVRVQPFKSAASRYIKARSVSCLAHRGMVPDQPAPMRPSGNGARTVTVSASAGQTGKRQNAGKLDFKAGA